MVSIKSIVFSAAALVLSASGVYANHWLTIVNGCTTRTVKPTLTLAQGVMPNVNTVTLSPGQRTVFKLESNVAYSGYISNALDGAQSSFMQFSFAVGTGKARTSYFLSNFNGFTIPQVAVAWPSVTSCATRRCYTNSCDANNAVAVGKSNVADVLTATSSCTEMNAGITLYYCSAQ